EIDYACGAGDVLGTRLLDHVDAGLEMLARIVVEDERASVLSLLRRFQGINEWPRQCHHSALPWQSLVHSPLKLGLCQLRLRGSLRAKQGFSHVIDWRVTSRVTVFEDDAKLPIQGARQSLCQDAQ